MSKCLLVLSGGQDSTTCLALLTDGVIEHDYDEVHAITFNYGQRHDVEIVAAINVVKILGAKSHEIITIPNVLKGTSPLVNSSEEVEQYADVESLPGGLEKTFVPARNMLFITVALNRAIVLGCDTIMLGVSQEDFGGYPDCRSTFIDAMQEACCEATDTGITLSTPLIYLDKKQTVDLIKNSDRALKALSYSHTCYRGESPPCGKCHACLLRQKGFDEAGIKDPLLVRLDSV